MCTEYYRQILCRRCHRPYGDFLDDAIECDRPDRRGHRIVVSWLYGLTGDELCWDCEDARRERHRGR